jgi:hypothetical protein
LSPLFLAFLSFLYERFDLSLAVGHKLLGKHRTREPIIVPARDTVSDPEAAVCDEVGVFARGWMLAHLVSTRNNTHFGDIAFITWNMSRSILIIIH